MHIDEEITSEPPSRLDLKTRSHHRWLEKADQNRSERVTFVDSDWRRGYGREARSAFSFSTSSRTSC